MEVPFKDDQSNNSFLDQEESCKVVHTAQDKGDKQQNVRKIVPKKIDYP